MKKYALIQFLLKFSFIFALSVLLLDIIIYQGVIENKLKVSALVVAFSIATIHLVIRLYYRQHFSENFSSAALFLVVPVVFVLTGLITTWEEYGLLFPNYFFKNFKFDYHGLPLLGIGLLAFGLVHTSGSFLKKNWRYLFTFLNLSLILGAGMLYLMDELHYKAIAAEDSWFENITALGFLTASVTSFFLIRRRSFFAATKRGQVFFTTLFIILGITLFFIAGEEISWGQRIFNIITPEAFELQNRQGEINIHNLETFWPYIYISYAILGLYGMFAWLISWSVSDLLPVLTNNVLWRNRHRIFIPAGYLFLNFLMICIYVWVRNIHGPWRYVLWEELSELLLVIGIAAHLIETYFSVEKLSKSSAKKK